MKKLSLLFCIIALLPGCATRPEDPVTSTTPEKVSFSATNISTSVFATVDWKFNPLIDGNSMYYLINIRPSADRSPVTKIVHLDMQTGETKVLEIDYEGQIRGLSQDDLYLYFTFWRSMSFLRTLKKGDGTVETYLLTSSLKFTPQRWKIDGDDIYMQIEENDGLFHYNRKSGTLKQLWDRHLNFDIDDESIFLFTTRDTGLHEQSTLLQMSPTDGSYVERAFGDICEFKKIGEYIYYLDESDHKMRLMRFDSRDRNPPVVVSDALGDFNEDSDAFAVIGEDVYTTNNHGELWKFPSDNSGSPELLDTWGPYDDDDFNPWIGSDGSALYWIAGPDKNVRISDDDYGALLKSVVIRKNN